MKSAAGKRPPDMTHSAPKKKLSNPVDLWNAIEKP